MCPPTDKQFEYPFSKGFVYMSAVLSGISIAFAIVVLIGEESVQFLLGSISFAIPALLLYFILSAILTLIILALKFYLYSREEKETWETHPPEVVEKPSSRWKSVLILLSILAIIALSLPLILLALLRPIWWFISISGFVVGINVPEIILYVYSRQSVK
jgi:hypothetical protein